MSILSAFVVGLLFGAGLIVAGMANPAKVLAFLDVTGAWDPSLAFVMVGAIAVAFAGFAIAKKRTTTVLSGPMNLPPAGGIDKSLIAGSLLFGIGWGLAGFCPGPALVVAGAGQIKAIVFVACMCAGLLAADFAITNAERRRQTAQK
jgi:uncharacterized membrane protein YedE/YeeE